MKINITYYNPKTCDQWLKVVWEAQQEDLDSLHSLTYTDFMVKCLAFCQKRGYIVREISVEHPLPTLTKE